MELALLILYGLALFLIFLYSLILISLVINYKRFHRKNNLNKTICQEISREDKNNLPFVSIQLPIYNEFHVAGRIIEAAARMEYPKNKFEVQVLDDSTDETVQRVARKVEDLRSKGFHVHHIRRENKVGFKAGALGHGLKRAQGEFIAIFDSDFVPQPDFLLKTLPHFQDEQVAVVQARWTHLNREYSLLTELQAFGLDAHFSIDQLGRNAKGYFFNFNGTAGIWRKKAIEDAGGWDHDTLCEDLDLSYRAQLRGWKFKYLEDVSCPSELPVLMSGVKSQQFRWNKGGAENFRKLRTRILTDPGLPFKTRLHALFHLASSSIFLCVFAMAVLSLPLLFFKNYSSHFSHLYYGGNLFLVCTVLLMIYYWNSYRLKGRNALLRVLRFFRDFVLFFSATMGLSLHNSIAVLEGHLGKRSPFVRTPKFSIKSKQDNWRGKKYSISHLSVTTIIEGLLASFFLFAIGSDVYLSDYSLLPLHLMACWGFGYVFYRSLKDTLQAGIRA